MKGADTYPYTILQDPTSEEILQLRRAYHYARMSDDPSTQVGAVIGETGEYNRQVDLSPPEDSDKNWCRLHAEVGVILKRARLGKHCREKTMFAPWATCFSCAPVILASGVRRVVMHHQLMQLTPARWRGSVSAGLDLLHRHHVVLEAMDITFGETIRFDGKEIIL